MFALEMLGTILAKAIGLMREGSYAGIGRISVSKVDEMENSSLVHEVKLIKLNTF